MFRAIYRFLASLKLAIILLAVLLYACAAGTYYESKYGAEVAGLLVYKTWWFSAWMLLLVVNLFCAAAIRYPWKPYQTGFVITHAGIIVLLLGGLIDRQWGVEGYLSLFRGRAPTTQMQLLDQSFQVFSPGQPDPATTRIQMKAAGVLLASIEEVKSGDVRDWRRFAERLVQEGRDPDETPGQQVWALFSEADRAAYLRAAKGEAEDEAVGIDTEALADILNRALRSRSFFKGALFENANLPEEGQRLLAFGPRLLSNKEVYYLNRLLLAGAYPDLVAPGVLERRPHEANSPDPGVQVKIVDVQPVEYATEDLLPTPKGQPMVLVKLQSPMIGVQHHVLQDGDAAPVLNALLSFEFGEPPAEKPAGPEGDAPKLVPLVERTYIFRNDNVLMSTVETGRKSGVAATIVVDEKGKDHRLKLTLEGRDFEFPVLENVDRKLPLDGLPEWRLEIKGFYPSFIFDENMKPTSESDELKNPCAFFYLYGPEVEAVKAEKSGSHGGMHGAEEQEEQMSFAIYMNREGKLSYVAKRGETREAGGALELGMPVRFFKMPGEGLTVEKALEAAKPVSNWAPVAGGMHDSGNHWSGALCEVSAGSETRRVWAGNLRAGGGGGVPVNVGDRKLTLGWDHRYSDMPFSVGLAQAGAQHQEGLIGSGSFMNFESTLSFDEQMDEIVLKPGSKLLDEYGLDEDEPTIHGAILDDRGGLLRFRDPFMSAKDDDLFVPMAEVAGYTRNTRRIWMNNPTTWPPVWYGPWLGTTYKFSQSDLQPDKNPDWSGIQVLRDPGWLPKWLGSLMICFGIFTMFYLKPYFRRAPAKKAGEQAAATKEAPAGGEAAAPLDARQDAVQEPTPVGSSQKG